MSSKDDVIFQCSICQKDVAVELKVDHQRHHKALEALRYTKVGKTPKNVDALIKRRKQIVKRLISRNEDAPNDLDLSKRINEIDEAFGIVRSDLLREKSLTGSLLPLIEKVNVKDGGLCFTDKEIYNDIKSGPVWGKLPDCVVAMGTSFAQNIQNRDNMQDRITTYPQFISIDRNKAKSDSFFVGLYDGYRGRQAAELTQEMLHHYIKHEIAQEKSLPTESPRVVVNWPSSEAAARSNEGGMITDNPSDVTAHSSTEKQGSDLLSSYHVLRACRNGYKRMDDYLSWGINETSRVRWSACSVATCIVTDEIDRPPQYAQLDPGSSATDATAPIGRIFIANAGSVEAYMCHNHKPFMLTQRHTTSNEAECKRIERIGGKIFRNGSNILVNGVVTTTRGLGNHGDVPLRKCIINDPHTSTARVTGNTHYVVIATSSVWSVFSVDEIFSLVNSTEEYLKLIRKQSKRASEAIVKPMGSNFADPQLGRIDESDEEELADKIEAVVIVHPVEDNDDDEDDEVSRASTVNAPTSLTSGESKESSLAGSTYKNWLAAAMSSRIVRAAIKAGASDNVSAVVILFRGYFQGRDIDYSFLDKSKVSHYI